jgi:hypothetical protein
MNVSDPGGRHSIRGRRWVCAGGRCRREATDQLAWREHRSSGGAHATPSRQRC